MDQIANMLTIIKNGGKAGKEAVYVPYSKVKAAIAAKLFEEGYINSYAHKERKKGADMLEVGVRYNETGEPIVTTAERVSKLSRRVYYGVKDLAPVRQGYGTLVLSTPKGILTDSEAREEHVGGEALFKIW